MKKESNKTLNRFLWQARQRSGLAKKNVAFLLGRKQTDEISRYENGLRIPTLQIALKLEIIYRVPVRLLFYEEFVNCLWQIRKHGAKAKTLLPADEVSEIGSLEDKLKEEDYCAYAELLKTPNLPPVEKSRIYDHLRVLAKGINKVEGIN